MLTYRAKGIAKKKQLQRNRDRVPLHMKRVMAQLKVVPQEGAGLGNNSNQLFEARVILNDFSPTGVGLFMSEPVMVGELLAITVEHPKRFYCKARAVWCQVLTQEGHIISQQNYPYRIGLEFIFETPEEQASVKAFYEEIVQQHIMPPKKAG